MISIENCSNLLTKHLFDYKNNEFNEIIHKDYNKKLLGLYISVMVIRKTHDMFLVL
jgi:hypothetical protein